MSHFCVLVIGEAPERQLEKYDENLELEMHPVATKEELIAKKRKWIEEYKNGLYAEYLKDKESYVIEANNETHIKFLEEKFPKMLEWTDEQCYEDAVKGYREDIKEGFTYCEIHDDGSLWKTTNEDAKWDWYQRGGRFRGFLKLKVPREDAPLYRGWEFGDNEAERYSRLKKEGYCDQALAGELSNLDEIVPFAIVKEGEWYERGEMGWWALVANEKEKDKWEEEVKALLKDLPADTLLTVVDCHI